MDQGGAPAGAPVLSTPAEHAFEEPTPATVSEPQLSEEQLYIQYEIRRTIREVRDGRWKRIALQFPDEMLVDAPRVFERLGDGLREERQNLRRQLRGSPNGSGVIRDVSDGLKKATLDGGTQHDVRDDEQEVEERLCVLGDTSYGACCVDEVAAEHVDAEVVVHYGRACLSPTARLPVIHVFTSKPLDLDAAIASFKEVYNDKNEKICVVADIPYSHHVQSLSGRLRQEGFENVFATDVMRDPSSILPNRAIPPEVKDNPDRFRDYSVFHISNPPTSLLLILSSRVKRIHIFPTDTATPQALEASTAQLLRRRYALLTRLSTVPIFGILINTLSVSNYMAALQHCENLISHAGKKSYVFVVGKLNAAKIANFSEIGGWVVVGCWESSLVESKEFFSPIITPFELEVALKGDAERLWDGRWIGDFGALLGKGEDGEVNGSSNAEVNRHETTQDKGNWDDQPSDDEPPDFDLRTGQYVSRSRPIGRPMPTSTSATTSSDDSTNNTAIAPPSSALVQKARGDVATINGTVSPAADFLRSKRTWQGLGTDYEIAYERDEEGRIRGAAMEEGRSGVAKGYSVGAEGVES